VHTDSGGAPREDDLGVSVQSRKARSSRLEVVAEAAEADGLELGQCGPRRRDTHRNRRRRLLAGRG
jgi:hypothetical protein